MMMRWWWWWWWWDDYDDEMTMMMMRWWWLADEYHRRFLTGTLRRRSRKLKPIWNQHWRPQDAIERPYIEEQVVGTDLRQFPAAVWFKTNHTAVSEPSLKKKANFRPLWNHLFSPWNRVWRRPYVAKHVVSTDSGTPKLEKNLSFWHLTAGFPQRVASNMKKSPKTPSF